MLSLLTKALSQIDCHHEAENLVSEILKELSRSLTASSSTFWQYDPLTGYLSLKIACLSGDGGQYLLTESLGADIPTAFPVEQYRTTRRLYFEGKPFVQRIDPADPDLRDHGAWLVSMGVKAVLQLPVIFQKRFIGWIPVHSTISMNPWHDDDIYKANQMANELALGLRIKELADRARESAVFHERANFAREMHDTLAQDFIGILIQLEVAEEFYRHDEKRFLEHLGQVKRLAQKGLDNARHSIDSLRIREIGNNDLLSLVRRELENNPIYKDVYVKEKGAFPTMHSDATYEVYRIVSEAVSNAVRHANAREITVTLVATPQVSIQVSDDGVGIQLVSEGSPGHGMGIMHERAKKIGAELTVLSSPGSGTTVEVVIPRELVVGRVEG